MADVNKTIHKTTGDYSTIAGFLAATNVTSDRWIGTIQDAVEYNESNLDLDPATGTPDATNYVKLTVLGAARHDGTWGTQARVRGSTDGEHVFLSSASHAMVEYLQIEQASTGGSDECVRLKGGASNNLFSRCLFRTGTTSDQDCVYLDQTGDSTISVSLDHCIFQRGQRCGLHAQNSSGSVIVDWTINLDHCAFYDCGNDNAAANEPGGGVGIELEGDVSDPASSCTVNAYNNWACENTGGTSCEDWHEGDIGEGAFSATMTWNGERNIASDTSAEAKFSASYDGVNIVSSTPSTEDLHVTDLTGDYDFTIASEGAQTISQNGSYRESSKPDSRQDFTIDIAGADRASESTYSIGPFEFITAAGGATPRFLTLTGVG